MIKSYDHVIIFYSLKGLYQRVVMNKDDFIEAEDYYEMGIQWLEEKEYAKAVESFKHVIILNQWFMYAYVDLAYAYSRLNRYHEAVQVLRKGSRYDPEFHRLYYLMAKYSFKCGDLQGALKSMEKALEYSEERLYVLAHKIIIKRYKNNC